MLLMERKISVNLAEFHLQSAQKDYCKFFAAVWVNPY